MRLSKERQTIRYEGDKMESDNTLNIKQGIKSEQNTNWINSKVH